MVDALRAAHRAVRPGGTIIDVRPDSKHPPRILRDGSDVGGLRERRAAIADNAASDRAVARMLREGLLEEIRSGYFWYTLEFADLAGVEDWLATSRRFGGFAPGTRERLAREPLAPLTVRRALAYGIHRRARAR